MQPKDIVLGDIVLGDIVLGDIVLGDIVLANSPSPLHIIGAEKRLFRLVGTHVPNNSLWITLLPL